MESKNENRDTTLIISNSGLSDLAGIVIQKDGIVRIKRIKVKRSRKAKPVRKK
jgi:hypothetical protein